MKFPKNNYIEFHVTFFDIDGYWMKIGMNFYIFILIYKIDFKNFYIFIYLGNQDNYYFICNWNTKWDLAYLRLINNMNSIQSQINKQNKSFYLLYSKPIIRTLIHKPNLLLNLKLINLIMKEQILFIRKHIIKYL